VSVRTQPVRADASACLRKASEVVWGEGEDKGQGGADTRLWPCGRIVASAWTRLCPHGHASIRADAWVRSHGHERFIPR
jgi:hypothetical protein